ITMEIEKMTDEIGRVESLGRSFTENAVKSSESSQSVSAVVEEQTANLQEIAASSSELLDTAEGLKAAINRFKL
ncbi:MAG TPA: methyl-accepting chemotaxis protein, partial [Ruminiclostridium sp.]|nr:methyl-accepting chemotaxis protein [Ruminiclostridium sp.]